MWNYRVLKDKNDTLIVAEVYYDDDKKHMVHATYL